VLLGKEVRSLWTVPDDCYLIGVDGSNLEGMIAAAGAYAFDGGDYLRIMESEDAHERNARAYTAAAGGEVTRDAGKGVTYGIMYGAQKAKIAVMLGITEDKAQNVIDAFWDSNLGLKGRREWLEQFWEATGKKFIPSFDGRKIWTRSKHSLLNAFQQSSGACLFDLVGIMFHHRTLQNGMYEAGVRRIIYYHDEYQIQVPKSFVNLVECSSKEEAQSLTIDGKKMAGKPKQIDGKWYAVHSPVGELMVKCVEQAAKLMLLPVHITGEYLVGLPSEGWSGTH
jgi:DNA polymerase I-like protein with 3'-5' exonuclease and polymerase domains